MNNKNLLLAAAMTLLPLATQAADVGVSVSVGQPGFYGRLDIGNYPRPELIYAEPVIIERVAVRPAPVYLHVPPGHEKNWSKHCGRYNACGRPVYFVRDSWYDGVYVPAYRERHGHDHDHDHHHGDHDHDHDHGDHGKGRGNKGKGKGKDRD